MRNSTAVRLGRLAKDPTVSEVDRAKAVDQLVAAAERYWGLIEIDEKYTLSDKDRKDYGNFCGWRVFRPAVNGGKGLHPEYRDTLQSALSRAADLSHIFHREITVEVYEDGYWQPIDENGEILPQDNHPTLPYGGSRG